MKKLFCLLLALLLALCALTACDRRSDSPEDEAASDPNFAPETTAVGGLTQAVEEQGSPEAEDEVPESEPVAEATEDVAVDATVEPAQEAVQDQPIETSDAGAATDAGPTPEPTEQSPFSSPTPQPNASVSQYTEVAASGLGFRFSYPSDWVNIPGRSTVCYVQPLKDGTVYPARVAVSMKRMLHKTSYDEAREELAAYYKLLMTQFNSDTFRVDTNLNLDTKFMGNRAISTTYLAYDGDQEIKGYTIITNFDRYLFVFHFRCAYDDYAAFEATLRYMRDSVQADDSLLKK